MGRKIIRPNFEGSGGNNHRNERPKGTKLFVGGLARSIDTERLKDLFSKHGDVIDAKSAAKCLQVTGAAGLMIGRAAIGNPCIFGQIKSELGWDNSSIPWAENSLVSAKQWAWKRYVELVDEVGGTLGARNMKQHAISFTKGLPGGKELRPYLHSIKDFRKIGEPLNLAFKSLANKQAESLATPVAIEMAQSIAAAEKGKKISFKC